MKELTVVITLIVLGITAALAIGDIENNERAAILDRMAEIQKETDALIGRP